MRLRPILLLTAASTLACLGTDPDSPPVEPPTPPPEAPIEEPPAPPQPLAAGAAPTTGWPLVQMARIPGGRTAPLPEGNPIDLVVAPDCRSALMLIDQAGQPSLLRWDFESTWQPVQLTGDIARPLEMAVSPFDGSLYMVSTSGDAWTIDLWTVAGQTATRVGPVYESDAPLSDLVVPFLRWEEEERVFFAREYQPGKTQILSVMRTGAGRYQVTSPDGNASALTEDEYRQRTGTDEESPKAPNVLGVESATPLSVHPGSGTLTWRDGNGRLHRRLWSDNWGDDEALAVTAPFLWDGPNGSMSVSWAPGGGLTWLSTTLVAEGGASEPAFVSPPSIAANGRTVVGITTSGVATLEIDHPVAPIRFLDRLSGDEASRARLLRHGISVRSNGYDTELYGPYEAFAYMEVPPPASFASIDGLLEVLHAGFEAVFMTTEREFSAPALGAFASELERAAGERSLTRVQQVAQVTRQFLVGDYSHADGKAALAEASAHSLLQDALVDFGDFKPRGPYAADERIQNYFRAFKYMNVLQLSDAERGALEQDAPLREAWRAWRGTQAAFLSGSRQQGALDAEWERPAWVRQACLEPRPRTRKMFPLNWGIDSEMLDRTTAHDKLPPGCTVPQRVLPTGLDLLTGLGSTFAYETLAPDRARWPELARAHDEMRAEFGAPVTLPGVVPGWLRIVQLLATDGRVPEGVDADPWRARLTETALASWTSLRHTMVLLNEVGGAEMGGWEPGVFETMTSEPPRGVVDPVPDAWEQLASVLDDLAVQAGGSAENQRLVEVLGEVASTARRFGDMARRQMRDEPLTEDEYTAIQEYGRAIEHPYLLLKTAAADPAAELKSPGPMMKIVDVYAWHEPNSPTRYWHAAVGRPRRAEVLLGDRGVLLAAEGAVYSYYEVVTEEVRLNDEDWHKLVDSAEPPAWSIAHDSWSPSL